MVSKLRSSFFFAQNFIRKRRHFVRINILHISTYAKCNPGYGFSKPDAHNWLVKIGESSKVMIFGKIGQGKIKGGLICIEIKNYSSF